MEAQELLARYAAGDRNFRGANLVGADLARANLSNADFFGPPWGPLTSVAPT